MIRHKPVIGLVGGIGSGKSLVARILKDLGAAWTNADDLAHEAYEAEPVRAAIRRHWGPAAFGPDGKVDRRKLAETVFASPSDLRRLEMILHPWIGRRRSQVIASLAGRDEVRGFVADSPLLFEANLDRDCDVIVFVESQREVRSWRLCESRGWTPEELAKRESRQLPLDFKRDRADYIVNNNSDVETLVREVRGVLARILHPDAAKL